MSRHILAFAREAGGVAAIAPVCKKLLAADNSLLVLSKDHGLEHFSRYGLSCYAFPQLDADRLVKLINDYLGDRPDMVFTSAASLPFLDMTERYLWRWADANHIPSVGLVDQWQNYALRFSGINANERLAYMPDYIFIMDSFARQEMVAEGIQEEKLVITGQPAFEEKLLEFQDVVKRVVKIQDRIGLARPSCKVLFVAEALRAAFGNTLGYDEQSVLRFVGDELNRISKMPKSQTIDLIVKLHPENDVKDFSWVFSQWPGIGKCLISHELTSLEAVSIADLVVGMTSIMMLESILVNKPTVSLQIGALVASQLVATKAEAIPFLTQEEEARWTLSQILLDPSYKEQYLARQKKWKIIVNGAENCFENIQRILGTHTKHACQLTL